MTAQFSPKSDEERTMLMAHLVKGGAQLLLDERGEVAPYALRLLGKNADPKTYFPKDQNPSASFEELFERSVAWAREDEAGIEIVGVAVISAMENEADAEAMAIGAQLETPSGSLFLFFPCVVEGKRTHVGEFEVLDELLVPEGIRWRLLH